MYPYQPLVKWHEIRLLRLLPGQLDEGIRCALSHQILTPTELPHYYAVSYTWGSPELTKEIQVNNITVPVRENLFQLLRHLRQPQSDLVLWIDALCIDQASVPEKNIQVPLMGQIYSCARSVFVWLGLHADGSEHFFDSRPARNRIDLVYARDSPNARTSVPTETIADAARSLSGRAYWSRTWIVQEIVLATKVDVFCGDRFCDWEYFTTYTRQGSENDKTTSDYTIRNILAFRNIGTQLPLRRLLFRFHMTQCSDPRDLVYSLLNIASDTRGQDHGIAVDYSSSVDSLFVQTLAFCSGLSCVLVQGPGNGHAIECLRFCDTLATRLGAALDPSLEFADQALKTRSNPFLAPRLECKAYFVRVRRFARISSRDVLQCAWQNQHSPGIVPSPTKTPGLPKAVTKYKVRRIPGKEPSIMWSFDIDLTPSDCIFAVDLDGPNEPNHTLCCVCRPYTEAPDSDGACLPSYRVIGLGVASQHDGAFDKTHSEFLIGRLRSLIGRQAVDSLPDYVLELTLQELVSVCRFARTTGAYRPWSLGQVSTVEHWRENQGPFGN